MPLISVIKEGFNKDYDYYRVPKNKSARFTELYNQLFDYAIVNGTPVPANIVDEFLMILDDVSIENKTIYEQKEKEVVEKVVAYFKDDKDFQFSKKYLVPIVNKYVTLDLETLVRIVVIHLIRQHYTQILEQGHDNYAKKNAVIKDAYIIIERQLRGIHDLGYYKMSVVAGYITMCFGYTLFNTVTNEINNAAIHKSIKRITKEFKPKEEKPKK